MSDPNTSKLERFKHLGNTLKNVAIGGLAVYSVIWGIEQGIEQHHVTEETTVDAIHRDGFRNVNFGYSPGGIPPKLLLGRCSVELVAKPKIVESGEVESLKPKAVVDVRDYTVELPGPTYNTVAVQNADQLRAVRPDLAGC
jgi:hypothetical protein